MIRRFARLSWMTFNLGNFWLGDENAPTDARAMASRVLDSGRLERMLGSVEPGMCTVYTITGHVDPDLLGRWTRLTRAEQLDFLRPPFTPGVHYVTGQPLTDG